MIHEDDYGFSYASDADLDREGARWIGRENPEQAWILSDRDVWHQNPFYEGPARPHPEEGENEGPYAEWEEIPW